MSGLRLLKTIWILIALVAFLSLAARLTLKVRGLPEVKEALAPFTRFQPSLMIFGRPIDGFDFLVGLISITLAALCHKVAKEVEW